MILGPVFWGPEIKLTIELYFHLHLFVHCLKLTKHYLGVLDFEIPQRALRRHFLNLDESRGAGGPTPTFMELL